MTKATWMGALNQLSTIEGIAYTNGGTWTDGYRGCKIRFSDGKFTVALGTPNEKVFEGFNCYMTAADYVLAHVTW
jgi:hypothetical protein